MLLPTALSEIEPAGFAEAEELAAVFGRQAAALDRAARATAEGLEPLRASPLFRRAVREGDRPGFAAAVLRALVALGSGDLSIGRLFEGHINAGLLIGRFAGDALQRRVAALVDGGALLGVWCADAGEPLCLSPTGDGPSLVGGKAFASGAGLVSHAIVVARLADGRRQMVLAPVAQRGRIDEAAWRPLGMRASMSYTIDLSGLAVDDDDLVGGPDDYFQQPWFTAGCMRFGAVQLGGALAIARVVHRHLRQTGRTEDPYQRHRVARIWAALRGARLQLDAAAAMWDAAADGTAAADDVLLLANAARHAVEEACGLAIELAVKAVGLSGMLAPHPLERLVRDLTTYLRQPGPDAALAAVGERLLEAESLPW